MEWLRERGYYIVERNWRAGRYEVDIIAENREFLVNRACQVYNGKRRVKVNSENNE